MAWMDLDLHFDNHTSSRSEGGHATLKFSLGSSVCDLDAVLRKSKILCDRQRSEYLLELVKAKTRLPSSLKKNIFSDIQALVTLFALKRILNQYELVIKARKKRAYLPPCTGRITKTLGLPCSHIIESSIADTSNGGVIKLEDINPHWRLQKSYQHFTEPELLSNIDTNNYSTTLHGPLLEIQNPRITRSKGRPMHSFNQSLTRQRDRQEERQRAFENSTQWNPSGFEYAERIDMTEYTHYGQPVVISLVSNQTLETTERLFLNFHASDGRIAAGAKRFRQSQIEHGETKRTRK